MSKQAVQLAIVVIGLIITGVIGLIYVIPLDETGEHQRSFFKLLLLIGFVLLIRFATSRPHQQKSITLLEALRAKYPILLGIVLLSGSFMYLMPSPGQSGYEGRLEDSIFFALLFGAIYIMAIVFKDRKSTQDEKSDYVIN